MRTILAEGEVMAIVDFALAHARQGRLVFPGVPNSKIPAIPDPYTLATTDEATIIGWWQTYPNANICLPGGYEIGPGKYLGFIDVDCKKEGKNGLKTMAELDVLGCDFPETLAQETPTGGLHLFYFFDFPIQNSAGLLGKGIDTRGFHGYVIGAGSEINGRGYKFKNQNQIIQAPEWLARRCKDAKRAEDPELGKLHILHSIGQDPAIGKSISFLQSIERATEGERNQRGYEAACRLKDFGCTRESCYATLTTHWACEPMLEPEELWSVVNSAFKYGQNTPGLDAAEVAFEPIPEEKEKKKPRHPVDVVSDEYALVTTNGGVRILWETKDHKDNDRVVHLSIQSFHDKLANKKIIRDEKPIPVSKIWMASEKRREYQGIIFAPNQENKKFFNVWRGFSVALPVGAPHPKAVRAVELFIEHIHDNVCGGNAEWANWVLSFFAHLIQKPEEKPGVALVLRGRKGVGKNVVVDCIFRLLGDHCLLAANRRYLSGNFNSHLENKLLLVLDEAFWSGDKAAEGILKDLITGSTQQIERKGHDSYTVDNLMRVVIFGNEEWIVPATDDERRFAVFNVGDAKQGNREYFGEIKDGMKLYGGDALLFKFLKEYDINTDVNVAPKTDALMSQKEHTLGLLESWWLASLKQGSIAGTGIESWPREIPRDQFRSAFYDEMKSQNVRSRLPNAAYFGRQFKQMASSSCTDKMKREGELLYRVYEIAPLEVARQEWEKFIGGKVEW